MTVTGEALQIISTSEYQQELEELIDWLKKELTLVKIEPTELQWTILINHLNEILYLIFDYPHKHYTFKHFEI